MDFRWPPVGWPKRHPHHRVRVLFIVAGVGVYLEPEETTRMAVTPTVGQTTPLSIAFLDQNGQPITPAPTPDSPPSWTNTTPATETLTVAAGGLTASAAAIAAGTDTINLSVVVGGKTFAASLAVTVAAAPQVLTSVEIVAGTPA